MSEIGILVELISTNHDSVMEAIGKLETSFKEQRTFCDGRFDTVEEDIKTHDRCISKSKGMVMIICAIWGAIITAGSLLVPFLWG